MNKPCCGQEATMPWMSLYRRCFNALKDAQNETLMVQWLMAVCIVESGGNGFWTSDNDIFKANLSAMEKGSKVSQADFLYAVKIRAGTNKGYVPKFRFEPSWFNHIQHMVINHGLTPVEVVSFSCSWGIAQKSGLYLENDTLDRTHLADLKFFRETESVQLSRLVRDLDDLYWQSKGQSPLMFAKYNAGASEKTVTNYAKMASGISVGFRDNLLREKLALCLDSTNGLLKPTL